MSATTVLHLQKVAGISGSEAHLLSLLPELRERGWDVRLLMLHEHEPGAWDFARALRGRAACRSTRSRSRADVDPIAFLRLAGYLVRRRPTILHTHLVHADVYGQLAGALDAASRCASRRSTASTSSARAAPSRSATAPSRASRTCTSRSRAGSRATSRRRRASARTSFEIVHYGIAPNGEPPPYEGDAPRLLCVGRLIPIKGHIVLLRAFAAARERDPGLSSTSRAAGRSSRRCGRSRRELGVDDAVRFLGYVAPIQRAIESSAIVVVPSMGEGFGMVALEAMERARPVIAAEIGGLGELVEDGETGLLVPPGRPSRCAEAIVRLAGDLPARREMGEAGRKRALSSGSWRSAAPTGPSCSTAGAPSSRRRPRASAPPSGRPRTRSARAAGRLPSP